MIYYNIPQQYLNNLLTGEDTGWLTISAAIMNSAQDFPDTTLVEGMWLQDTHCAEGSSQFDHTNSRAIVTLGTTRGREHCIEADADRSVTMFYRNQACRAGRNEFEEFVFHTPPVWQPKCIVILLEAESRAHLRDTLVEQGRILIHPLRIEVNYTTSQSTDPDLAIASINCALGRELLTLYEHDRVGQDARDHLVALQNQVAQARAQAELFSNVLSGLSAYRPPTSPPPPSSPPVPVDSPPAPPRQVHPGERLVQLRENVERLEAAFVQAASAIDVCVPSTTQTCGRSSQQAPNPWLAANGEACAGNGTWEALEGGETNMTQTPFPSTNLTHVCHVCVLL